jgi:glycyl-tRNA synthetase beta chain
MTTRNLLVELFVEELPPKALKKLGESFAATLSDSLKTQGLATADAAVTAYASPRRLAVHVANVADRAVDKPVSQKLMPVSVGLDAGGNATPALLKRLAGLGAGPEAVAQLKRAPDGKNEALFYDSLVAGAMLADGLQKALEEALAKLPIPKVMGYQLADGWSTVNFVRPAHGLVALHGSDIVPISVLGLNAGNTTQGHRFEAANPTVTLKDADSYAAQMENEGAVIASFEARRAEIVRQLNAAADAQALKPIQDDALLDEVTALVERPNVLLGQFEETFLEVPQECDPHHEGEPEVFSAAGCQRETDQQVPHRLQHPPSRPQSGHRRQRSRGAPASGRRQILLRPRPQEDTGVACARSGQGGVPQQAGHAGRARAARLRDRQGHWPATRRRHARAAG